MEDEVRMEGIDDGGEIEDVEKMVVENRAHLGGWLCGHAVEFGCLKVVNQMSYLTVGSLENTSRLVDVSLNWTINSTG